MQILIASPYDLNTHSGNAVTAKRIESLLNLTDHRATAIHSNTTPAADILIALHARKTWKASSYFKKHHPQGKLIIFLTGTDLYQDLPQENKNCLAALDLADTLVVSQAASLQSIPAGHRHKARVVRKSILLPEIHPVSAPTQPSFALIGHLREVKNPFLFNRALEFIPDTGLHAFTLGKALESCFAAEARVWERTDKRFKWLEDVPYQQTLSWISQVTASINTSHMEGGSNAVGESIVLGTPVLASKIEGNIGMLGEDYDGYFEPNKPQALAQLIQRTIHEPSFLQHLRSQTQARQHHFSQETEIQDWLACLQPAT